MVTKTYVMSDEAVDGRSSWVILPGRVEPSQEPTSSLGAQVPTPAVKRPEWISLMNSRVVGLLPPKGGNDEVFLSLLEEGMKVQHRQEEGRM